MTDIVLSVVPASAARFPASSRFLSQLADRRAEYGLRSAGALHGLGQSQRDSTRVSRKRGRCRNTRLSSTAPTSITRRDRGVGVVLGCSTARTIRDGGASTIYLIYVPKANLPGAALQRHKPVFYLSSVQPILARKGGQRTVEAMTNSSDSISDRPLLWRAWKIASALRPHTPSSSSWPSRPALGLAPLRAGSFRHPEAEIVALGASRGFETE